jgi:hypothetical protein
MYDDLKRNYLKKDKDIKDIEQLLGKTTVRRIYKRKEEKLICLQYHLGACDIVAGPGKMLIFCPKPNGKMDYKLTSYNDGGYSEYNVNNGDLYDRKK